MTEGSSPTLLLYQTEDGRTRIDVRFDADTIWLTQAQIAELYLTTPQNITLHIAAIYDEGELDPAATCKPYLQVRQEGARGVRRTLKHYSTRHPRHRLPRSLPRGTRPGAGIHRTVVHAQRPCSISCDLIGS